MSGCDGILYGLPISNISYHNFHAIEHPPLQLRKSIDPAVCSACCTYTSIPFKLLNWDFLQQNRLQNFQADRSPCQDILVLCLKIQRRPYTSRRRLAQRQLNRICLCQAKLQGWYVGMKTERLISFRKGSSISEEQETRVRRLSFYL